MIERRDQLVQDEPLTRGCRNVCEVPKASLDNEMQPRIPRPRYSRVLHALSTQSAIPTFVFELVGLSLRSVRGRKLVTKEVREEKPA